MRLRALWFHDLCWEGGSRRRSERVNVSPQRHGRGHQRPRKRDQATVGSGLFRMNVFCQAVTGTKKLEHVRDRLAFIPLFSVPFLDADGSHLHRMNKRVSKRFVLQAVYLFSNLF